jgi:hypothetical protein
VEACLEVGRGLAVLKVACGHGNFIARLDVLGIETRVAQRFMHASVKFSNAALTPHLIKAIGNRTKLFEMLVLDDEQLEELELTGQTGELHLDEIATMSVKELRGALREAQAKADSKERQLAGKDAKINELDEELNKARKRVAKQAPDTVAKELRSEASVEAHAAESAVTGCLRPCIAALVEHGRANNQSHDDFIAGLLCQIEASVAGLRGEFQIKDKPDGDDLPEWMRPGFDAKAAAAGKAN